MDMPDVKMAFLQITDQDLWILWVQSSGRFRKKKNGLSVERIAIPEGVVRQGQLMDMETLNLVLKAKLELHKSTARIPVYLVLTQRQGFCRFFTLPWISLQGRGKAIQFLLAEEFSFPMQEILFDFLVIGEKREDNILQVFTGVSRKSVVDPFLQVMERVGLKVKGIYFSAEVAGYALNLRQEEDTLYVDLDGEIPQLILWQGLYPKIMRVPLVDSVLSRQISEGVSEVHRLLLYADSQQDSLNLQQVYTCGTYSAAVAENLGLKENCIPLSVLLEQKLPGEAGGFTQADITTGISLCGASERQQSGETSLNLFADELKFLRQRRFAKSAIAIFIGVTLLAGSAFEHVWQVGINLEKELIQTREQAEKQAGLVKIDQEISIQWKQAVTHPFEVAVNLMLLDRVKPSLVRYEQIQYKEGAWQIQGFSANAREVGNLMASLGDLGWQHPVLTSYKLGAGDQIEFTISALQSGSKS